MIHRLTPILLGLLILAAPARAQVTPPTNAVLTARAEAAKIDTPDVTLEAAPHQKRSAAGEQAYTRRQGNELGVDHIDHMTPNHFFPPFWNGRGLGAGDVNRDGYQDLLVATEFGPRLYINQQGLIFTEQKIEYPGKEDHAVHSAALVDVDNDGWLDVFFTTYANGNHYIRSDEGQFPAANLVAVAGSPHVLTMALSFGDIDEDGDLDAILGNWFFGYAKQEPAAEAANRLLFNEGGHFRVQTLDEIPGDTLSVLLTDLNLDDHLDLIVGNDFKPPDYFYYGDGQGGFEMIRRSDGIIPASTDTTMSVDTGDFDNDLRPDIYIVQIASAGTGEAARVKRQPFREYCQDLNREADRRRCEESVAQSYYFEYGSQHQPSNITKCKQIPDPKTRSQCAALMVLLTAVQSNEPSLCDRMPKGQEEAAFICRNYFKPSVKGTDAQYAETVEILMNQNLLLHGQADGTYENVGEALGVAVTAWGWNARFFDFDNDEWQDLYVVNGTWMTDRGTPQKFAFRNIEGKRFEDVTDESGLQNYQLQNSYVTVDVDNDGDLDLFVETAHGPVWFYKNNEVDRHAVTFELRDEQANRYCIGCKVRIRYGDGASRAQLREIKAGGGFLSFDPSVAHFGLGANDAVRDIEVTWSTGEKTRIEGPLPADARYTITRGAAPDAR